MLNRIKNFVFDKKILLIIILVIAAFLRIWKLGNIPPHLTPDEAALGYNAYSILKTGKDEYGQILPIIFKSFGDYKPGLYIYLTVPFVATLGLNEFAVRLPSALSGVINVLLIYFIVYELFKNKKLSLISAFIASFTPWLIFFSRGAWEVNVSLTLTLAGIYFFFKSLRNSYYLIPTSIFFALTVITYQGAKLSTAIVMVLLVIFYWKEVKKLFLNNFRVIIISTILGLIIISPILIGLHNQAGRLEVFSLFSYKRPEEILGPFLSEGNEKVGSISYYLFHSENLNFFREIMSRYFNHFSARFLFFEGDWANPRHSSPYQGELLLSDMIILFVGCVVIIRRKINKEIIFVILWLILAPLPSILSRDQVHAIRSYQIVIPLIIILSFGLNGILDGIKNYRTELYKYVGYGLVAVIYLAGFIYYLDSYFVHLPIHDSQYWEYGYKQIVETVTPIQKNFKEIRVQQSFAQPYIFFLFFQKYDPAEYQKQAKLVATDNKNDVGQVEHLDNIYFGPIDWTLNRGKSDTLFVADTIRIPVADSSDPRLFKTIREIRYLNGRDIAFRIIQIYKR